MKSMNDRELPMREGKPLSEGFFPEDAHREPLRRTGEIRGIDYPDNEEDIHEDQEQAIRASDRARQREGFRH